MKESIENSVMKTKDWVVTILVSSIPIVGFIMLFVWAFGSNTNKNRENWAKGMLIVMAIVVAIYFTFMVFFGVTMLAGLSDPSAFQ